MIQPFSRKSQRGITLLEVMVSIGIMATVTAGVAVMMNQQSEDTKAAVTALHLKAVGEAANAYIKDNYAAVTGLATPTTPVLITVPMLAGAGYLNAGYSTKNPRGQDTCVLVLEAAGDNLTAMVVTEGGETIDDLTLGQIASLAGESGGGIYSNLTTAFRGAMGAWETPIGNFANPNNEGKSCNGTAGAITLAPGHPAMVLRFADGASISASLYRDAIPGNPELNTMNTPIIMGPGTVQVPGDTCSTDGTLGRSAPGNVVSCVSGVWAEAGGGSAYWGDPVDQAAAMPACSASNANETRVRFGYATTPTRRLFTCDGSAWQAVGINHAGDLSVPGGLTVSGPARFYGATDTYSTLTTHGQINVRGGAIVGTGQAAAPENSIVLNTIGTENSPCTSPGMLSIVEPTASAAGGVLVCQEGLWRRPTVSAAGVQTVGASCSEFGAGAIGYSSVDSELLFCPALDLMWRKLLQSRVVSSTAIAFKTPSATAYCDFGEIASGGGGECVGASGGVSYIWKSLAVNANPPGWTVACDTPIDQNVTATVSLVCFKQ